MSGSAGTGKTIVALHRAVHLARTNPDARVLLTTFSDTLANALHGKLGDGCLAANHGWRSGSTLTRSARRAAAAARTDRSGRTLADRGVLALSL